MNSKTTSTIPNHSERDHAKHSPSSLKFKEICPGWINDDEDKRFEAYADEGTLMHEAAESGDLDKLNVDQKHFVTAVINYVDRYRATSTEEIREKRVFHDDPILRKYCHGTPDLLLFHADHCHLVDYKFGRRPVDHPSKNLQGFAYSLAVFDTYPEVQDITVHFLTPRVADGFNHHTFNRSEYGALMTRVKRVVERCEKESKNFDAFNPDFEACLYCGNKFACGPLKQRILEIYEPEKDPIDNNVIHVAVEAGEHQTEKDVSALFKFAKVVKAWAEQYERIALNRHLQEGFQIDGYELRFRKGRVSIKDTPDAVKALKKAKIPLAKILAASDINQKKLETLLTEGIDDEDKIGEIKEKIHITLSQAGLIESGKPSEYLFKLNKNKKK